MGSQRVRKDWETTFFHFHYYLVCFFEISVLNSSTITVNCLVLPLSVSKCFGALLFICVYITGM